SWGARRARVEPRDARQGPRFRAVSPASAGDRRGVVPGQLPDPPVFLEPAQAAVVGHVVPAAPFAPHPSAELGRVPGDVVAIGIDPGEVGVPEPDLALDGQAGEFAGGNPDRLQRPDAAVVGPVVAAAVAVHAVAGPHEGEGPRGGRYRQPGYRLLEPDPG